MTTYYEDPDLERGYSTTLVKECESALGRFSISHGYTSRDTHKVSTVHMFMTCCMVSSTVVLKGWVSGDPEAVFWEALIRVGGVGGVKALIGGMVTAAADEGKRELRGEIRKLLGL